MAAHANQVETAGARTRLLLLLFPLAAFLFAFLVLPMLGLLRTSFQGGKGGVVTYELIPEGEKTRLVLTHSEITSPSGFQDFGGGWNSHLTVLQEKLAGRDVRNFWELHAQSRDAVAKALG